jgi:HK97 family phage prohead protease
VIRHSPSLHIEKSDPATGVFSGIAWAFASTPDRENDIILKSALVGAVDAHRRASQTIPVRVEHQPAANVGALTDMAVDDDGLRVSGRIHIDTPSGRETFARVKSGELGGLSLGFDGTHEVSGPIRVFTGIEIVELSVCRSPINAGSRVHAIKSWRQCENLRDLEHLLKGCGMPGRLAGRVAKAGWSAVEDNKQAQPAVLAALERIISA